MATKAQIKDAVLKASGNPESGAVYDLADAIADAVFEIDNPRTAASLSAEKETRVTKPTEVR